MNDNAGLITAFVLDGNGGGRACGWSDVQAWSRAQGVLWMHLDYREARAHEWIRRDSGLDPVVCEALLAEETRPRSVAMNGGLIVILRGVNTNPGADPEDMVSIRMWIDADRVITTRHRRLLSADDMRAAIVRGQGPATPGEFLVGMANGLVARMADVIDEIDAGVDHLEEQVLEAERHELRSRLGGIRRQAIMLRRYLAPQREAMTRLQQEQVSWLRDIDRMRIREIADRITRYVEDLDSARERAAVTQEELASRLSEQMNRRIYVLSLVAAVFLPLGFLTGLLGVNVGGIPGADDPWGFVIVCTMMLALVSMQIWFFRRRHWF